MKKFLIILLISLCLVGTLAYYIIKKNEPDDTSSQDYISEADKYLDDKQYSKALEQYKLAINTDPSNTNAFLKAAEIYTLKSKDEEAIEILKNGESTVTNPDAIHSKIGTILFENYDVQSSLEYFEKAYEENPNNWENTLELVKVYSYFPDREEDSRNALNKIKTDNNDGLRWKNYYLSLLYSEDPAKMISYLEETPNIEDDDLKERINQLLQIAKKMQSDPEDIVQNNTLLSYEMINSELYSYAITLLDTVISENDEYYAAYMYKGICYISMNDLDKAIENLSTSITIDPDQLQPRIFLAQVYTKQNNQKDAIDTYEETLNLESDNEDVRYDYAKSLVNFNLYSQAKHQYDELISFGSENKLLYTIELVEIELDYLENYSEALDAIKRETENSSTFQNSDENIKAQALDILGWAYYKNSKKDDALKYLTQSIEVDPYNAKTYYHLGIIYKEIENGNESKINLERAIDLDLSGQISSKASNEIENMTNEDSI